MSLPWSINDIFFKVMPGVNRSCQEQKIVFEEKIRELKKPFQWMLFTDVVRDMEPRFHFLYFYSNYMELIME